MKGSAPNWSNPLFLIFLHSGAVALRTECQIARMSKIKNGGLDYSMTKCKALTGLAVKRLTDP